MDKLRLFGRAKNLEAQLDDFLNKISESAVLFKLAIKIYLSDGANGEFSEMLSAVNTKESEADNLRRDIEKALYTYTLIPDSRGDVLGLIETLDQIINSLEGALWAFDIEKPAIPDELKPSFQNLTEMVVEAVDALVLGARAFFRTPLHVGDYNHKVMLYEKEADKLGTRLKKQVFASNLDLAHKMHLRQFVEHIDDVADQAEDVSDRLAIYAIKRIV